MKQTKLSMWAFRIGVVIAILYGIQKALGKSYILDDKVIGVMILLGIVVGLVNLTTKEIMPFLVSSFVLYVMGGFVGSVQASLDSLIPKLGTLVASVVQASLMLVFAIAVVIALKEAWLLSSKK